MAWHRFGQSIVYIENENYRRHINSIKIGFLFLCRTMCAEVLYNVLDYWLYCVQVYKMFAGESMQMCVCVCQIQ